MSVVLWSIKHQPFSMSVGCKYQPPLSARGNTHIFPSKPEQNFVPFVVFISIIIYEKNKKKNFIWRLCINSIVHLLNFVCSVICYFHGRNSKKMACMSPSFIQFAFAHATNTEAETAQHYIVLWCRSKNFAPEENHLSVKLYFLDCFRGAFRPRLFVCCVSFFDLAMRKI